MRTGWTALVLLGIAAASGANAVPAHTAASQPNLEKFLAQSQSTHNDAAIAGHPETAHTPVLPDAGARFAQMASRTAASTPSSAAAAANPTGGNSVDQIVAMIASGAEALGGGDVSRGLSAGMVPPAVPALADLDHATAQAIVSAFAKPNSTTAEQQAENAASAASDPVFEERVGLVRTLYRVDGTDAEIRHFIATVHMKLIITEVNNHIEIGKLSDPDKYRLSAIAAAAETQLEEKVLIMNARHQAANMSKPEILQLITAYDSDAQRKLTGEHLADTGKLDRALDLEMRIAQYQIVKKYEAE